MNVVVDQPENLVQKEPKEKQRFFPKLLILFGLVAIVLAVVNFFNLLVIPELVINTALLLAGVWMLKISIERGFYKKRKEIFKKYI